jgi:hypothetical protein
LLDAGGNVAHRHGDRLNSNGIDSPSIDIARPIMASRRGRAEPALHGHPFRVDHPPDRRCQKLPVDSGRSSVDQYQRPLI